MTATNTMLKACEGLLGTTDITEWEQSFLENVLERSRQAQRPDLLTERQVETLERVYRKHFAS